MTAPMTRPEDRARTLVAQYYNREQDKRDIQTYIHVEDVYIVWFCYTLGGWKALVSTTVLDEMYYEVTYDFVKKKTYIDAYKKHENVEVHDGDNLHSFPKG